MTYQDDIKTVAALSLPWEKLYNSNILITGASGLIGSCLVEVLMERQHLDYHVYALGRNDKRMEKLFQKYLSNNRFHIIIGDITKPLNSNISFHYIIHAASGAAPAEFVQNPVEVMMANIEGVHNLIDYGRFHEMKRFLYISSGEVYGEGDGRIFTEDYSGYVDCTNPRSCYPSSKRAAETLCVSYALEYNVDVVIARPCHIYGPHFTEFDNRVYAQFLRNVLNGEDISMKSSGEQFRSWCYVVDCVFALLYILLKGENGQAYNIADDNSNITIKRLAEIIAEIGGRKVVVNNPSGEERKGYNRVTKSVFSTDKIKKIGFVATTTIEKGLYKTIRELSLSNKSTHSDNRNEFKCISEVPITVKK